MRQAAPGTSPTSTLLWALLVVAAVAACSRFGSSSAPGETGGSPDGGADVVSIDEGGARLDASDGAPDTGAASCSSETVLVGTDVLTSGSDLVPAGSVDAYGFAAGGIAVVVARCVRLHVANISELGDGKVLFGVYDDGGETPGNKIATATFTDVKAGWNVAELDDPVNVAPGATYWLAFTPTTGSVRIPVKDVCGNNQDPRHSRTGLQPGALPSPFDADNGGPQCGASVFLTP